MKETAERLMDLAEARIRNAGYAGFIFRDLAAGGPMSDVMMLCESVLVGVVLGCFQLGSDVKAFDLIVTRVKERLARVRLEDLETKGSG